VIASIEVTEKEVSSYGIMETTDSKITKFIEKPNASETQARHAAIGKYILTPDIFEYLENAESSV